MAFWKVEGPDGQAHSPNGDLSSSQRLLPNHPCKTGPNVRLRESWPNYLERMNPAVGANLKPIEFVGEPSESEDELYTPNFSFSRY